MKKTAIIFGALFTVFSCNNPTQKEQKLSTEDFSLVGKSVSLSYPDFKADISYSSDSILHWRTIQPDGNAENGDEKMNMKKIADSLFFVN
ncbi:MAG: hypothetical protein Q4G16_12685, partial [Cruoricaptor ignavus]|nr:hypothetical protein [Cruoricaptor ignavus]